MKNEHHIYTLLWQHRLLNFTCLLSLGEANQKPSSATGTSCFIYSLLLEMMVLRLQDPFLALIDTALDSCGSFYAPLSPYGHHLPLSLTQPWSSLCLAQGRGRDGNGGLDHIYDSHSCCPFLLLTLLVPESHGQLIMEQGCCPLICVCHMSCLKPPLSYSESSGTE